jgi:hypothetical protein
VTRPFARLAAIVAVLLTTSWAAGADPMVQQETKVVGTAPDLSGRWLLIATLGGGGGRRATTSVWDVTTDAGGLHIRERYVTLPFVQAEHGTVDPTAQDLQAIAESWETLAPAERGFAQVRHEIMGPDGLDDSARLDPLAAGAVWIVRQSYAFAPGASRPSAEHRVFAADARDGDGWTGKYADAIIAMVPLPVPITLQGTFRLIRIPSPVPSFWARIADVFRGCR